MRKTLNFNFDPHRLATTSLLGFHPKTRLVDKSPKPLVFLRKNYRDTSIHLFYLFSKMLLMQQKTVIMLQSLLFKMVFVVLLFTYFLAMQYDFYDKFCFVYFKTCEAAVIFGYLYYTLCTYAVAVGFGVSHRDIILIKFGFG